MKLYVTLVSDAELRAIRHADDLAWRGIRRHPQTQTRKRESVVLPCSCGLCERAPQTALEASIHVRD